MVGFPIEVATRIKTLPPYLFAAIDKMKQAAIARGVDIINLGIGDPDLPTPAMTAAIRPFTSLEIRFHLLAPTKYKQLLDALL